EDARPAAVLTSSQFASLGAVLGTQAPAFEKMRWITTDTLSLSQADEWRDPQIDANTLAFLQYTSGSTATPKGVMLTHGNLLHNLALIHQGFGHSERSHGVIWLPPYHDMGLIGGILQPLYGGFPVTLMSPVNFLQRPLRWLQAISRTRATTSGGPNFAYELCVSKTTPEQRAGLDLSSWQVAFTGAEPIRPDTLQRFTAAFAPAGFRPESWYACYGLAEATLIVSGSEIAAQPIVASFQAAALEQHQAIPVAVEDDSARLLVSCGQILGDQQLAIVNPATRQICAPDEVGEIWVASGSVAQGYWNRQAETEQTFQARIAGSEAGPFLRTGDLGFLQGGDLFVTGRLKDLIIIRGRNHYPQDIELTVERSHAAIRPGSGAAFSVDVDGEERLVIVQEIERLARHQSVDPIIDTIHAALAEQHEVQAHTVVLIKPGSIPKTSSGKIQRHRCRAAFLAGALDVVGSSVAASGEVEDVEVVSLSRDELLASDPADRQALLETYLRGQLAQLLRLPAAHIDPQSSVSALGLDSLMAIELQHVIETRLGVGVPMVHFLEGVSLAQLAQDLLAQLEQPAAPLVEEQQPAAISTGEYPLSAGQRAIWFLHQLAPESAAYNIATAVRIRSSVDVPALRRSFQRLVDRHPQLRATFSLVQGAPVQQVHQQREVWLHETDASTWSEELLAQRLVEESQRPFDLQHGPLLKIHLFRRAPREQVLLLVIHHIVADFWSLAVLMQELDLIYPAEQSSVKLALGPLTLGYADYVVQQQQELAGPAGDRLLAYWRQQLAGELPILNLPTDRPRPQLQTYRGATQPFQIDAALTQKLKDLSRTHDSTLYMLLLAAFQVLLHRYSGQTELLVGSPTTGRYSPQVAPLVGYFVNPVVIRGNLAGNPSFSAFLQQIRQTVLGALAHQGYPFPLLAQQLQPERDPGRSPLFQAMFILQKTHLAQASQINAFAVGESGVRLNIGGLSIEPVALEQQISQFDLTLTVAEVEDRLAGSLQYNSDLFDAATIARMAEHWQMLLEGIVEHCDQPVADLPLLTAAERDQLALWNSTALDYDSQRCLHELFAEQAKQTPNAIALTAWGDGSSASARLTYAELNRRADAIARYLRTIGVGPDVPVGLYMERTDTLVAAILGVLKAGGCYVPLDPAYPTERLQFVLEDTRMPVLLTQ
ncbi:MAG TPA: condensation domain-containing protein, partial [Herpetosiphonaceae bacterium]